ncbi:MAG: ArsR family transcriptional regulator [Thaumarchaeota archaeon]|nr:ArsR family transcriptional regulator [Nitrososphaerota archaeon]MCL5316944.1 ArsR family transcriptional regulator [Nitrososphaerota archaeon]
MVIVRTESNEVRNGIEFGKALSSKRRLEILRVLSNEPMSIKEIADNLSLNPVAIRHHIKILMRSELVEEVGEKRLRFGRPTTLYGTRQVPQSLGYPRRRYDVLSEILIQALIQNIPTSKTAKILKNLGYQYGANLINDLSLHHGIRKWDMHSLKQHLLDDHLKEEGSQPEIVKINENEMVFRLHNCVFSEISRKHPEIICNGLDLGIREGILERSLGFAEQIRNKCKGHGDPYCEFVFIAKNPETGIAK